MGRRDLRPVDAQNLAGWEHSRLRGETCFNERGFNAGRALYNGVLLGRPFRSVAKTFQVRVWRSLMDEWNALPAYARAALEERMGLDPLASSATPT